MAEESEYSYESASIAYRKGDWRSPSESPPSSPGIATPLSSTATLSSSPLPSAPGQPWRPIAGLDGVLARDAPVHGPHVPEKDHGKSLKKWREYFIFALVFLLVIIAVVGGVLGSRLAAQRWDILSSWPFGNVLISGSLIL